MNELTALSLSDVEILEKKSLYQGYYKLTQIKLRFRLFSGEWSEVFTREVFERGHSVGVLLYDAKTDEVVLVEQIRVGAVLNQEEKPWFLEIAAGMIEENETPEIVALRESKEETCCDIKKILPIGRYYLTSGACTETIHMYCGIVDSKQAAPFCGVDPGEDIRVHVMPRIQAYDLIITGKVLNIVAVTALQWLQLNFKKMLYF